MRLNDITARRRVALTMRRRIVELRSERATLIELYDDREAAFIAGQTALGDDIVGISRLLERYWREVRRLEFVPMIAEDVA
jgi:3'-phosphoadenosine 5'-phosphosulfate sulfotransferase